MSTLLVDAGNTRIKWRPDVRAEGFAAWPTADVDGLSFSACAGLPPEHAIVSCVAGEGVMQAVTRALRTPWPAIEIHRVEASAEACGIVNEYAEPVRLGADRWASLIGARAGWPAHPLLVCGFGTATTIDLLIPLDASRARFAGGAILPGYAAMRRCLATTTADLQVGSGRVTDFATRTEDAIESGVQMAQLGAVTLAIAWGRTRLATLTIDVPLVCLLAGGDAGRIATSMQRASVESHVVPDLVLRGLSVLGAACTAAKFVAA